MTGDRLLLKAIRGEAVERRPLWIMRQAGRYLPEYRELRQSYPFKAVAQSPELAARVTLMPMARFPFDAAIVFADIMSPLPALGVKFDFESGPGGGRPHPRQGGGGRVDAARSRQARPGSARRTKTDP